MDQYQHLKGKYRALLRVIVGMDQRPFLTQAEDGFARTYEAKEQDFDARLREHSKDQAKEKARTDLEKFGRGEITSRPASKDELIASYADIRRSIKNARVAWVGEADLLAFFRPIIDRAKVAVETYAPRLEAQERHEAEVLGLPYEASQTLVAVHDQALQLDNRMLSLMQAAGNVDTQLIRTALADLIDWEAAEAKPLSPTDGENAEDDGI